MTRTAVAAGCFGLSFYDPASCCPWFCTQHRLATWAEDFLSTVVSTVAPAPTKDGSMNLRERKCKAMRYHFVSERESGRTRTKRYKAPDKGKLLSSRASYAEGFFRRARFRLLHAVCVCRNVFYPIFCSSAFLRLPALTAKPLVTLEKNGA